MSLVMEGVKPKPIEASTFTIFDGEIDLRIGGHQIPLEDFRFLVMYVMCNSNISPNDPRLELLEDLRSLIVIEDEYGKRLSGLRPLAQHFSRRGLG